MQHITNRHAGGDGSADATMKNSADVARAAQRLAEKERRILQDEYFAHAEKAMDNLRSAKENAAAIEGNGAAQGVRFQMLMLDNEGHIKQKQESSLTTVLKTEQGDEAPKLLSKNSIAQDAAESKGNSEPVKKSVRFQLGAPVEVDTQKDLVAVHNLTEENLKEALELGGILILDNEGHIKQKQESADTVFKTEEGGERPGFPVKTSIAQDAAENKENSAPVKKNIRFQKAEQADRESRNAANKKEPDRKVRQEPLLAQEAAFPGSSDLTITDFYDLVKHDANFTKYFSDEVAYKAERVKELEGESRNIRFSIQRDADGEGYVKFDDSGKLIKKEDISTHLPMDVRSFLTETQEISSKKSIARNDAPVKKNIRFQLGAPVEVDTQKDIVAVHNLTEENLKEALELGGMPPGPTPPPAP